MALRSCALTVTHVPFTHLGVPAAVQALCPASVPVVSRPSGSVLHGSSGCSDLARASRLVTQSVNVQWGALTQSVHCAGKGGAWEELHAYDREVRAYARVNEQAQQAWLGSKEAIASFGWSPYATTEARSDVLSYVERVREELVTEGVVTPAYLLPDLVRAAIAGEKFNRGGAWGRVSAYLAGRAVQHLLLETGASPQFSLGWFADEARTWAADREVGVHNFAYRVHSAVAQLASESNPRDRWGSLLTLSRDEIAALLQDGLDAYVEEHSQGQEVSVLLPRLSDVDHTAYAHFFGSREEGQCRLSMPLGALMVVVRASGLGCTEFEVSTAGQVMTTDELYSRVMASIAADDEAEALRTQVVASSREELASRVRVSRSVAQLGAGRGPAGPLTRI